VPRDLQVRVVICDWLAWLLRMKRPNAADLGPGPGPGLGTEAVLDSSSQHHHHRDRQHHQSRHNHNTHHQTNSDAVVTTFSRSNSVDDASSTHGNHFTYNDVRCQL